MRWVDAFGICFLGKTGGLRFRRFSLAGRNKAGSERRAGFDTGLRHGTVTAVVDGHAAEITTYRTESGYSDFEGRIR